MIKINLVPREFLLKESQRQLALQASAVGVVFALVLATASGLHWYRAVRLEATLKERELELDKLAKIVAQVEELERQAAAVRMRLNVITDLLKGRSLYPVFMMDFSRLLPDAVWISSLGTSEKSPNQLSVNTAAQSSTSEGIADWLRNIERSGKFSEPNLSAISISGTSGGVKVHSFSIQMTYKAQP